jgi:zinc D-Ala-D-Ala carboxypeptidase
VTKISEHFTEQELTFSSTAIRLGIKNEIPDECRVPIATLFNLIVEPLRVKLGVHIHIDSAYRCLELNRAIKSADDSQHVKGEAADLKIHGMTPKQIADKIVAMDLPYDQLIEEFGDDGWCHVSYSSRHRRMRFKIPKGDK